MAKVSWSRWALLDLRDIHSYIAQDDPRAADRTSRRLQTAANALVDFPRRARVCNDAVRVLATVRPYLIFYRVDGYVVTIMTVHHGSRQPPIL